MRSERQLWNHAAVAITQPFNDPRPKAAIHQHTMQQNHYGSIATRIQVRESSVRRSLELQLKSPLFDVTKEVGRKLLRRIAALEHNPQTSYDPSLLQTFSAR